MEAGSLRWPVRQPRDPEFGRTLRTGHLGARDTRLDEGGEPKKGSATIRDRRTDWEKELFPKSIVQVYEK